MPKVATENVMCIACGADVRSEALFCYNCGGAVASQTEMNGATNDEQSSGEIPSAARSGIAGVMEPADRSEDVVRPQLKKEPKPLTPDRLRKKRASNRQPVEVFWEAPASSSNAFIIASIGITIAAAIVLALALYLK